MNGDFSAGPLGQSVELSFIGIAGTLRSFPVVFHGHLEAHYEWLGFYLDGDYLGLDFKPLFNGGIAKGLSTELGVMDYGVSYRLFGSTASERVAYWEEKSPSNILDLYAGGRTIWLGNQLEFRGIGKGLVMKKEPGYKIDPVSAATRSHFAAWILAISSLFASSKLTQTKVCSSFSASLMFSIVTSPILTPF